MGASLLTSSGNAWFQRRKQLTPAFHFNILERFMDTMVDNTIILVDRLIEDSANPGKAVNICEYLDRATLDILCESVMGFQINAQKTTNSEFINVSHDLMTLGFKVCMNPIYTIPFVRSISPVFQKYIKLIEFVNNFSNNAIRQKKLARKKFKEEQEVLSNGESIKLEKKKRLSFLGKIYFQ